MINERVRRESTPPRRRNSGSRQRNHIVVNCLQQSCSWTALICHKQYRHIQSDLLSKCNLAVEQSASRHSPATSWKIQDPSQQFPFHLSTGLYVLFLSSALHWFYPKLLFIVCCTAFSIHICLFTRGAILLGTELVPLLEDEDKQANANHCVWAASQTMDVATVL